jgi:hypothetical protein
VIAIGPSATEQIEGGYMHLEMADIAIVDSDPTVLSSDSLRAISDRLGMRPIVVCLFDDRDEAWWDGSARVAFVAAQQSDLPLLFVCSARRPWSNERRAMLQRLARRLNACVIEAPDEPGGLVRAAALSLDGLCFEGLVGFDPADFATVTKPPCIGRVAFAENEPVVGRGPGWERVRASLADPGVAEVLVSVRCLPETQLEHINAVGEFISNQAPEASILLSAIMRPRGSPGGLEVGVVACCRTDPEVR